MSAYSEYSRPIRVAYLLVAAACWAFDALVRLVRAPRRQAVVLCYHGITPRQRDAFARQMATIAGRVVDIAQQRADGHAWRWPRVCVTFDDAFVNLLDNALPALAAHDIPAVIFAVPGNLGTPPRWRIPPDHPEAAEPTMTPAQLLAVSRLGPCRVASHTFTHVPLGVSPAAAVETECVRSKEALEALLARHVEDLALPYGSYTDEVLAIARRAGYRRIHTLDPCLHPLGTAGTVGRFSMDPEAWRLEFALTCAGAYRWLHPWRRLLRRLRGKARAAAPASQPPLTGAAPYPGPGADAMEHSP